MQDLDRPTASAGGVAIVTGAAKGIGRAIALRLAGDGYDVAAFDLDANGAEATARDVRRLGQRSRSVSLDVRDRDGVHEAIDALARTLGRVAILVNNAGVGHVVPFPEITPEIWQQNIDVHLTGAFHCTQAAAREMSKNRYGRVVNIASVAGLMGPPHRAAYATVKAGLIGFTRAVAVDLADDGITVNAIAPGPIDTHILSAIPPDERAERTEHMPIRRLGRVEEIARAASFLASPESAFITGTTLVVDGGGVAAGSYMVERYRQRRAATMEGRIA